MEMSRDYLHMLLGMIAAYRAAGEKKVLISLDELEGIIKYALSKKDTE